ncbi:MAG: hemerythrin family protein [Treponema sp.]|jgi:hemerythrin|nr:hemerythrin family protein [Treponema sp.]
MEYVWSDSLSVGHEKIDGQHKQLFAAINDLIRVSQSGNTGDELKKSLDFLNDYTIKHFFEEEQLQLKFQYPDYENHKKLHEGLKQVLRELMHEWILKGSSKALAEGIKVKIGDWLVTHIKAEDTKLGAHIKSKS